MHLNQFRKTITTKILQHLSDNVYKNYIISFTKIEFIAGLLYWIGFSSTRVPNKLVIWGIILDNL